MTKRMLIDATHAEETRVVVLDGNRLEDFDVETSTKKQLKGNIYLAKVVRVEPSLQAAFVEYGGGRHGFLAFGEIHPDYYQIPVADRQRLLAMQAEEAREEAEAEEAEAVAAERNPGAPRRPYPPQVEPPTADAAFDPADATSSTEDAPPPLELPAEPAFDPEQRAPAPTFLEPAADEPAGDPLAASEPTSAAAEQATDVPFDSLPDAADPADPDHSGRPAQPALMARDERYGNSDDMRDDIELPESDAPPPETIGGENEVGDSAEEARARRTSRFLRNYRIQEVIKRRQILLVQVVKEERGTKGAALTTYISLAGRFCVLMPNSPRGGGISRKITSASDRRRLKEITSELDIPTGMGLIVRTAGANRPKPEIKRDCEYLMRLWDDIRDHTMRSVAPALIYEEASLIKRAIRDVYSRDIDEVLVDGEEGWKAAHDFMRMLMPSHAKKVQAWRGNGAALNGGITLPLFAKYQVEAQLDGMVSPTVQLKSGGYLVINQTEALVAIDVNSGRSTRERGIEETALRTNLEAADEVARQLRLRDLAGLIVIDFIDMDAKKHNAMVERRIKDALKIDRARIQVGHISHFGLLEMSRQRLRPSLAETSFIACPHCGGLGHVRSTESSAIHVLRAIEEEGAKARAALIMVHAADSVVMYLLNHKRARLAEVEAAYAMQVQFTADESLLPPNIRIDRLKPQLSELERPQDRPLLAGPVAPAAPAFNADDEDTETEPDDIVEETEVAVTPAVAPAPTTAEGRAAATEEANRHRRRRRRRGRRDPTAAEAAAGIAGQEHDSGVDDGMGDEAGERIEGAEPDDLTEPPPAADSLHAELVAAEVAQGVDPALGEQPSIDAADLDENGLPRAGARRRGRRGGRRRRRGEDGSEAAVPTEAPIVAPPPVYVAPAYSGPTPADPFGGGPFDIFDMMEMEPEESPAARAAPATPVPATPVPATPAPATPAPAAVQPAAPVPELDIAADPLAVEPLESAVDVPIPTAAEPVAPEPAVAEPAVAGPVIAEPVIAKTVVAEHSVAEQLAAEPVIADSMTAETIVTEPVVSEPVASKSVAAEQAPQATPAEPIVGTAMQPIVIGQDTLPNAERKRGWWKK
jgi:ribonuclease E